MFQSLRETADPVLIDCDICVIGAGAAGISIAREFFDTVSRVCVVESGGFDMDGDTQDLYQGEVVGRDYDPFSTRLRFLGGSTNAWGGVCSTFSAAEMEEMPWVEWSGWPIGRKELDPFYGRAQSVLELGPFVYDERMWDMLGIEPYRFNPDVVMPLFYQYSPPTRFGERYREELRRSGNVRVLLDANVSSIESSPDATRIDHVEIRSLDGKSGRIRAGSFVLACGGLENPRLLLVSNSVEPAGLGNRHDLVGRFFMEHPLVTAGTVITDDYQRLFDTLQPIRVDGVRFRVGLGVGRDLQRREGVLNGNLFLNYTAEADSVDHHVRQIGRALRENAEISELASRVWRLSQDFDAFSYNAYRWFIEGKGVLPRPETLVSVNLVSTAEQAPNFDSRVTLGDELDGLSQRRLRLDWRLTAQDKRTVRVHTTAVGSEFARMGIGRVKVSEWMLDDSDDWGDMNGARHHMGTTRMADSPHRGVVDRDCRVHGIDNLYVAGSSVFPTGGASNPTLTLVALALRLADHLKARAAVPS
jgi:choline dehydrogenase-like flavoprotein